jgi:DNA-binding response OmpR family regulator
MSQQVEKILLVATDQELLMQSVFHLQRAGYGVVMAENGREALQTAQVEKPDLAIVDLKLPDASGVDLCRRLRNAHLNIHIIILTSKYSSEDHIASLEAGADDFIIKPVNPTEFVLRVKAVLRRTNRPEQPQAVFQNRQRATAILPQNEIAPADKFASKRQTAPLDVYGEMGNNSTLVQLLEQAAEADRAQNSLEARELYLQVLKMDQYNETALTWLAWHTSDAYEGVRYLEKLVEKHPENTKYQEYLAAGKNRIVELDQLISGSGVLNYWTMAEKIQAERTRRGQDRRSAPITPVGQLLLKKKFITQDQLDTAIIVHEMFTRLGQPKKLGEVLLEYGYLTPSQLQEVLNEQLTDFNNQFY